MTANQRRSGFRLPWSSEGDAPADADAGATDAAEPAGPEAARPKGEPSTNEPVAEAAAAPNPAPATSARPASPAASNGSSPAPQPAPTPATPPIAADPRPAETEPAAPSPEPAEEPSEFLRDLIAAMRKVADEARQAGVSELRAQTDEAIRGLESDAERRSRELRERAEADITGVGEWARAEAERIKAEAEQRVTARRVQLEQQLSAETTRTEAETRALRTRVDDYERELEAYHAQLSEINDPAAFAAAAKRMPSAPALTPRSDATVAAGAGAAAAETSAEPTASEPEAAEVHPAEEEVLAARLAELDEKLGAPPAPASADASVPVTTDVIVKGLGSFGAITGFRQSLASQEGISAVALSLGQTGEFVFRATHAPEVDVANAITALEGDGATVEQRPEGGLRVTLERAR